MLLSYFAGSCSSAPLDVLKVYKKSNYSKIEQLIFSLLITEAYAEKINLIFMEIIIMLIKSSSKSGGDIMGMSFGHLVLLFLIVLVIFGAGKVPQVMGDLARGIRAFKDGMKDAEGDSHQK